MSAYSTLQGYLLALYLGQSAFLATNSVLKLAEKILASINMSSCFLQFTYQAKLPRASWVCSLHERQSGFHPTTLTPEKKL